MRLFQKSKTKKLVISFIFTLFILSGVLFFLGDVHSAFALEKGGRVPCSIGSGVLDCIGGNASKTVGEIGTAAAAPFIFVIQWILYGLIVFFQLLASFALLLFEWVIDPGNISGPNGLLNLDVVYQLWKAVRDFFNLFFILILLFSAFATIFQVDQFSIKKIYLQILLAALLVNFSFPISRFLIDTANVPMYYFANAINPNGTANGGQDTAYGKILSASSLTDIIVPKESSLSQTPFKNLISGLVFMFIFSISVVTLAVMMFVRLIGLVLLVIFSSVGFVAGIIPGLSSYSSDWWNKFWKYAFFGPAAMLMLFVSVSFLEGVQKSNFFVAKTSGIATNISATPVEANFLVSIALFSIPIILIWASLGVAQIFSIAGADAVSGWGKKVSSWAWKAPWAGVKFAAHKADKSLAHSKRFNKFSIGAWQKAWKERDARLEREGYLASGAVGDRHDALNMALSRINIFNPKKMVKQWSKGAERTDYGYQMRQSERAKYQKEQLEKTGGNTDEAVLEAQKHYAAHDNTKLHAAYMNLAAGKDLNDLIIAVGGKDAVDANGNPQYDPVQLRDKMIEQLMDTGSSEQEALRQVRMVSDAALVAGNFAMAGAIYTNPDGTLRKATMEEWKTKAVEKWLARDPQERVRTASEQSFFNQKLVNVVEKDPETGAEYTPLDAQGKPMKKFINSDLHEIGAAIATAIQATDAKQIDRMNDKLRVALVQVASKTDAARFQTAIKTNSQLATLIQEAEAKSSASQKQFETFGAYVKQANEILRTASPPEKAYVPHGSKEARDKRIAEEEKKEAEKELEKERRKREKDIKIDLSGDVAAAIRDRDNKKPTS